MPKITISDETNRLIADQVAPGVAFRSKARRLANDMWQVPVDDEVAAAIEAARRHGGPVRRTMTW